MLREQQEMVGATPERRQERAGEGQQQRPWLALVVPTHTMLLYSGVMLKSRTAAAEAEAELAPIQRLLPEELMQAVLACLDPYSLGRCACVCRQWRALTDHPKHWEAACREAFGACHKDVQPCERLVRQTYRSSWRRLFLEAPHLRFAGLYISRNTYVRQGAAEWRRGATCHLVTYFRYFRFFPDGSLLYRTSPLVPRAVARSLAPRSWAGAGGGGAPGAAGGAAAAAQHGRYVVKGSKVYLIIVYPNSRNTEVRVRCAIRGVPHLGAANRLDLEELAAFDHETGSSSSMLAAPDEEPDEGSGTSFRRGLAPCVFVPWEGIASSVLNLPAREMDFYVPG